MRLSGRDRCSAFSSLISASPSFLSFSSPSCAVRKGAFEAGQNADFDGKILYRQVGVASYELGCDS